MAESKNKRTMNDNQYPYDTDDTDMGTTDNGETQDTGSMGGRASGTDDDTEVNRPTDIDDIDDDE